MSTLKDIENAVLNANKVGRDNLSSQGVDLPEDASTLRIMQNIAEVTKRSQSDYSENDDTKLTHIKNRPFHNEQREVVLSDTVIPCKESPDLDLGDGFGTIRLDHTIPMSIGDRFTFRVTGEYLSVEVVEIVSDEVIVVDATEEFGVKGALTLMDNSGESGYFPYYFSGATSVEVENDEESGETYFHFVGKLDDEGNPIIDKETGLMVADENSSILVNFHDTSGEITNAKITMVGLESLVTETVTVFNSDYVDALQSDYNENDSTKPSYIKNRLVYEGVEQLDYTRLKYDDIYAVLSPDSHSLTCLNHKVGVSSGESYKVVAIARDPETGEIYPIPVTVQATLLTEPTTISGRNFPAGAIEVRTTDDTHSATFLIDGVIYDESTDTMVLGEGCVFDGSMDENVEYRFLGIPSEELIVHKLPSKFVGCDLKYNPGNKTPQSGVAVQEAVLSTIPEVPRSLGDAHVKVVVNDDSTSPTGKKVSIYSEGIGQNYSLRTTKRDTIVNAINEVYDNTINNQTSISQNTRNITKNAQDISKNTKDLTDRGQDITNDAFKKTVEGTRLEITDISPVSHKLEVSVTPAESKNLIRFPRSELVMSSSFKGTYTYYADGRIRVQRNRYATGGLFILHLRNSRGGTSPDGTDPLPAGDYTIRLNVESVSSEDVPLPYIFVDRVDNPLRLEANTDHVLHIEDGDNWTFKIHWDLTDYVGSSPYVTMSAVLCEGTSSIPYTPPMLLESMLGNIYVSSEGGEEISTKRSNKLGFVVGLPSYFPITKLTSYISDTQDSSRHYEDVAQIRCTYLQSVSSKISSLEDQIKQLTEIVNSSLSSENI